VFIDALQLKKYKNKLWKRYCTTGCSSDLLNCKTANNKLRQLTCNLRRIYEKDLDMNIGSKPNAFWKYMLTQELKLAQQSMKYKCDGTFTSEHSEMVNLFNDYFCSVFTSKDHFIPPPEIDSSPSIIDTLVITPQLVSSKLNNLISGKAPGPDGWPTELLKSTAESICLTLSLLYNKSFFVVFYLTIRK